MLEAFVLPAISLGLSAVLLPGPLQAYLISNTLAYRWKQSIIAAFSPLVVDIPIIILLVFLLGSLPDAAIALIRIGGGLFLLWLAWSGWQSWRSGIYLGQSAEDTTLAEAPSRRAIFSKALLINALSPGPYLFWSTITGPLLVEALNQSLVHGLSLLVAFYGTFISGLMLLVMLFDRLGGINPRVSRLLMLFTLGLMAYFGLRFTVEGVAELVTLL